MSKTYGKAIAICNETLFGNFPANDYENCTIIFKNCTFIDFQFFSRANSIELHAGNTFCESILLDATKVIMKESINTENLTSLSINGGYFKMPEGAQLRALSDLSISSDIQSFKKNHLESLSSVMLQSSYGTTVYQDCEFIGKHGVKISALKGDLKIENCLIEATASRVDNQDENCLNGIYLSCYGSRSHMYLVDDIVKTDVLECTHPNYMVVRNTELYKIGEYGRFLSRNQEIPGHILSQNYLEEETSLDEFYPTIEAKKNKLKLLELFGFKKVA